LAQLLRGLLVCWGALWGFLRIPNWKNRILVLSLCGNALFITVLIVAFSAGDESAQNLAPEPQRLPKHLVARRGDPLCVAEAATGSELGKALPNALYVIFQGRICARFEFESTERN
jgi:hypothetical protein